MGELVGLDLRVDFSQFSMVQVVRLTEIILGVITIKVFTMKRFGRAARAALIGAVQVPAKRGGKAAGVLCCLSAGGVSS